MNKYMKAIGIMFLISIMVCALLFGGNIPFKEQMPIYDGLRNTSAIIFAVMGAWIALLYPSSLSKAFRKKTVNKGGSEGEQITRLFKPMIYSTVILMIVIGMSFVVPLAKQVTAIHQYKEVFRAASFSIIGALTYIQLWSLIMTLLPSDQIKDDFDEIKQREEIIARMKPGNIKRRNDGDADVE